MSAQYRPYRDEESVDGIDVAWSDHEPGSVQIYEKTTEELPFNPNNNRALWLQIALFAIVGLLGFCLGFFAPFHPTPIGLVGGGSSSSKLAPDHSVKEESAFHEGQYLNEDSTIKNKLLTKINGNNIMKLLVDYDNTDRAPGSYHDHKLAQYVESVFREYDFDRVNSTNITFKIMLPQKSTLVAVLNRENKTLYSNANDEKYPHDGIRAFLPLSQANATTITTDQILYGNKGSKDDFKKLIDLSRNETEGKIIVLRQTFYQVHDIVIEAQELGAKAVLLFPDPEIYGDRSVFPESVRLPDDAERSHPTAWSDYGDLVSNSSSFAGVDVSKLGIEKESKVQIPVIPISLNTAKMILRGLSGQLAPSDWNCFSFTLYVGPGYRSDDRDKRDKVHIEFYNEETIITTSAVTGIIKGSSEPDRYVIIGSRRDSLTRGLLDSISGTAVMLELARVYGSLLKEGWRPKRTIVFNSFGAESLNLIGSSLWIDQHQRLLQMRAVAYLNCDQVVIGDQAVTIAASPLLYQVVYNSTKQVRNPNHPSKTIYDVWKETNPNSPQPEYTDNHLSQSTSQEINHQGSNTSKSATDEEADELPNPGSILAEYTKTASIDLRPKFRRLDLHSIYSPFFLFAGIPVADVRYAGFESTWNGKISSITHDTMPLIGSKYDNLEAVKKIDGEMKSHVAVTQVLAEILRDLSDSTFLPFNLLDYSNILLHSYLHLIKSFNNLTLKDATRQELHSLETMVHDFMKAAISFHQRQDKVNLRDILSIRQFNDQLMLLERAFLDPFGLPHSTDRKHMILSPNDGQESNAGFPALIDWIALMDATNMDETLLQIFIEILKVHYRAVEFAILNAIQTIDEVHTLG